MASSLITTLSEMPLNAYKDASQSSSSSSSSSSPQSSPSELPPPLSVATTVITVNNEDSNNRINLLNCSSESAPASASSSSSSSSSSGIQRDSSSSSSSSSNGLNMDEEEDENQVGQQSGSDSFASSMSTSLVMINDGQPNEARSSSSSSLASSASSSSSSSSSSTPPPPPPLQSEIKKSNSSSGPLSRISSFLEPPLLMVPLSKSTLSSVSESNLLNSVYEDQAFPSKGSASLLLSASSTTIATSGGLGGTLGGGPGGLGIGSIGCCRSTNSSPIRMAVNHHVWSPPIGPRFKLIQEGDIQVCRLNHTRTVVSKILSSKFLRRWETHKLYLTENYITSKTPTGFMDVPIYYSQIEDMYIVSRWDSNQKYCIRIVIPDGSILLQVSSVYHRNQWLHSIQWKKKMLRYKKIMGNPMIRVDILLKELKSLVELTLTTPLQDESVHQKPLEIISDLLGKDQIQDNLFAEYSSKNERHMAIRWLKEQIIAALFPLLDRTNPTNEICHFLSQHCREFPRSSAITDYFGRIAQRVLKHNMDFSKYPKMRLLVQDYLIALSEQNDGLSSVRYFVKSAHGFGLTCPHPRVLPNLVSICLAAVYSYFEETRNSDLTLDLQEASLNDNNTDHTSNDNTNGKSSTNGNNEKSREKYDEEDSRRLECFIVVLEEISKFEDWKPLLSQLLQPIPFPDAALSDQRFTKLFKPVIQNITSDNRCDVHQMILGIREEKGGWFQLYCPGNVACDDEGHLWSFMLKKLISCCCRRKSFLTTLNKCLGPCMLRALRDDETCQETLCAMLELDIVESSDMQLQIITTLQSTNAGKKHYTALCERQLHLRELQQKGGPRKLTLPSRSTDMDLKRLLSSGSFGNLECLSLAFTQVTSACAEQLIKLPSLKYLNLWSTQFGDSGLELISEHLDKLQVLNLCETPVTDKGLKCISAMKNIRKLNLNSTSLSAQTFECLKRELPALQECDVRYTDAW